MPLQPFQPSSARAERRHRSNPYRLSAWCLSALLAPSATVWAQTTAPAATVATGVAEPTLDIRSYVVDGSNPLSESETQALLAPFVGEKKGLRDIEAAAAALEAGMRAKGYAFHRMFVPVQKPTAGEIRLQVIGITLGSVQVEGNEHFSAENIRRSLGTLQEGEVPEVQTLGRDVTASNANPAKQVSVTFKESAQPGKVDAVVRVKDSPPMVFFTSLTTNQRVGGDGPAMNTHRLTGGFQHSNLFDRDHVATVSYTTDPTHVSDVTLIGAYYQVPIYGTGMNLSASYVHSDVSSGRVQQGAGVFDVSGSGRFAGVRLTRALARSGAFQQTVGVGLEDRLFENSTTFNGAQIQPDVSSRVVSLQYTFRNEPAWGIVAGSLDYAVNIGGGSHNSTAAHLSNGGRRNWNAWRYSLEAVAPVSDWNVAARLKGQYSSDNLISGEQFGLGGTNSVRGFADRVVTGDYGYQWGLEAAGPGLGEWQIRPIVFLEGGIVHARALRSSETLSSVGVGMRLVRQQFQMAVDLAKPLDGDSAAPSPNRPRLHVALSYRF